MNYDENLFKEKANKKARRIWLVFALLLSANYGSDAAGHLYPMNQYVIFLILCWVPFLVGDIILKIKGKASDLYRLDLVIGYGIFYTFVLCTTASPIAFTYILPVTSLLVLYSWLRPSQFHPCHPECSIPGSCPWLHFCIRYEKLSAAGILYPFMLYLLHYVHLSSERI